MSLVSGMAKRESGHIHYAYNLREGDRGDMPLSGHRVCQLFNKLTSLHKNKKNRPSIGWFLRKIISLRYILWEGRNTMSLTILLRTSMQRTLHPVHVTHEPNGQWSYKYSQRGQINGLTKLRRSVG